MVLDEVPRLFLDFSLVAELQYFLTAIVSIQRQFTRHSKLATRSRKTSPSITLCYNLRECLITSSLPITITIIMIITIIISLGEARLVEK